MSSKQILDECVHGREPHPISLNELLVLWSHHDKLRRFMTKICERPVIDDISIKAKSEAKC